MTDNIPGAIRFAFAARPVIVAFGRLEQPYSGIRRSHDAAFGKELQSIPRPLPY